MELLFGTPLPFIVALGGLTQRSQNQPDLWASQEKVSVDRLHSYIMIISAPVILKV